MIVHIDENENSVETPHNDLSKYIRVGPEWPSPLTQSYIMHETRGGRQFNRAFLPERHPHPSFEDARIQGGGSPEAQSRIMHD